MDPRSGPEMMTSKVAPTIHSLQSLLTTIGLGLESLSDCGGQIYLHAKQYGVEQNPRSLLRFSHTYNIYIYTYKYIYIHTHTW